MERNKSFFPVFISMEGKHILMAGGGRVAARRAESLLSFGPKIHVVSPVLSEGIKKLIKSPEGRERIIWKKGCFQESCLAGMDMVLAATDDEALNHRIAELCREKKLPVNNASCQADCDFYFPAILCEEGLVFGVSSGGEDHRKVRQVCGGIREYFRERNRNI